MKEQVSEAHVFKYSIVVQQILDKAGWHPGRRCQRWAARQKRHLESKGFIVYPATVKVLEEFGELTISNVGSVVIEPDTSKEVVELFKEYEILTKVELCPLGRVGDDDFVGIDPQGSIYYVGDWIWYLGDSFNHALECLVMGKKCPTAID